MIGERTRQALAAAKARGIKRGNPEQAKINRSRAAERAQVLRPHLEGCIKAGCTSRAVPSQRISTRAALRHQMANGFPMQVRRVRDRLGL
jgi:DNA invertase Pin-like site-specific DNA recombinase